MNTRCMEADAAAETPPEDPADDEGTSDSSTTFLSVTSASTVARVADETIRKWYDTGEIAGYRIASGRRLIDPSSLTRRLCSMGVREAAEALGCCETTIRVWFDQGRLSGYRTPSGRRRINRESVLALGARAEQ